MSDALPDVAGKTALITGANRGVGLGLARAAKEQGMTVLATARKPEAATDLRGVADGVFTLDTGDPASVAALGPAVGDRPIHLLINNAGIFPQRHLESLEDFEPEPFNECMRVNVTGPLLVTKALLPNLRAGAKDGGWVGGKATVGMISSALGSLERVSSNVDRRWYAYCASKAALNMATVLLRKELGAGGIDCTAIHPGWVRTDMGGSEADLTPEQSAAGILGTLAGPPADRGDHQLAWDGAVLPF